MKVNFLHLCDHAIVDKRGKLSAIGIFSAMHAPGFPVTAPQFFLAFQSEASVDELGKEFELTFRFMAPDNNGLLTISGQIKVADTTRDLRPILSSHAFRIPLLTFVIPGEYRIEAQLGDGPVYRHTFHVLHSDPSEVVAANLLDQ